MKTGLSLLSESIEVLIERADFEVSHVSIPEKAMEKDYIHFY
jgi:hypothetical protein